MKGYVGRIYPAPRPAGLSRDAARLRWNRNSRERGEIIRTLIPSRPGESTLTQDHFALLKWAQLPEMTRRLIWRVMAQRNGVAA